jgi:hypothetical protein
VTSARLTAGAAAWVVTQPPGNRSMDGLEAGRLAVDPLVASYLGLVGVHLAAVRWSVPPGHGRGGPGYDPGQPPGLDRLGAGQHPGLVLQPLVGLGLGDGGVAGLS